jgi:YidC/Oxa1 family membrane protein insertase
MDQRRLLLALLLSLGVLFLYNEFVVKPREPAPVPVPGTEDGTAPTPSTLPPSRASGTETPPPDSSEGYLSFEVGTDGDTIVVETDVSRATLTTVGGRLLSLRLKHFRQYVAPDSPLLELVAHAPLLPLTLVLGPGASDAAVAYRPSTRAITLTGEAQGELILTGAGPAGQQIEKRIRFLGNSYLFDADVRISGQAVPSTVALVVPELEKEGLSQDGSSVPDAAVVLANGKISMTNLDPATLAELKPVREAAAQWIAFSVPFFAGTIVSPDRTGGTTTIERAGSKPIISLERPLVAGATGFKVFMGPKSEDVLTTAGFELGRLLDFGWFWFIAIPMLYALRMLHRLTANYGIDIILLTALVRVATLPLTQKSFRSMKEMQKIQPQLKRLQEQHKDDQAKLQKEMMELYKRAGVNPFGGCAPMLLQIPIFVGLYNALLHAIELRHAAFGLWITDLSAPERLVVAGYGIPVLTLLMGGTMVLQQWLTPSQGMDPAQRQMMMLMPIIFTFMFVNFPSGLVLYWLVSNVLGIAQQYIMLRPT